MLLLGLLAAVRLPQSSFGQAPLAECGPCPVPEASHLCCVAAASLCQRADLPGAIVEGTPRLDQAVVGCTNCCKYEPDSCPGNDLVPEMRTCEVACPNVCQSLSVILDPRIINPGSLAAYLDGYFGIVGGMDCENPGYVCTVTAARCEAWGLVAWTKSVQGRSVAITHYWQLSGKWVTLDVEPCVSYTPCPYAGNVWVVGHQYCGVGESSAVADMWLESGCEDPVKLECPEREPCP